MLSYTIHMDTRYADKIKPGKPQITPGLPIWANLEKPVKRSDPIRAIFKPQISKGAHYAILKTAVLLPFQDKLQCEALGGIPITLNFGFF
jgi:hypothetical protein